MKYTKQIAGFRKEKGVNYHTKITLTKGEQIAIWIFAILFTIMVILSMFVVKNVLFMVLTTLGSILVLFSMVLFFLLRPLHKEERIKNQIKEKYSIDISYNNITGDAKVNKKVDKF